jgi:hypothetical protein
MDEAIKARSDIVDRLIALPLDISTTDAGLRKAQEVCHDAVSEIKAMRAGFKSLSRAIEREGYAILMDDDGKISLERRRDA